MSSLSDIKLLLTIPQGAKTSRPMMTSTLQKSKLPTQPLFAHAQFLRLRADENYRFTSGVGDGLNSKITKFPKFKIRSRDNFIVIC